MIMPARISIRAEQPGDGRTIANIVQRAYADVPYSDHREHDMVDRLRETDAYIPALSLLAEVGSRAVGHVLLTRATIRNGLTAMTTLALAPLSVLPEARLQGVGRCLVGSAHRRAAALGFRSVLLIGMPAFYSRLGYEPLSRYPIRLPFEAPGESCMVFQLQKGALDGVAGEVDYAEGWLNH